MARASGSYPAGRWFKSDYRYQTNPFPSFSEREYGPVVKRLRHRPFTAVTRVRFSSGSPIKKDSKRCLFLLHEIRARSERSSATQPKCEAERLPKSRGRHIILGTASAVKIMPTQSFSSSTKNLLQRSERSSATQVQNRVGFALCQSLEEGKLFWVPLAVVKTMPTQSFSSGSPIKKDSGCCLFLLHEIRARSERSSATQSFSSSTKEFH